MTAAEAIERIDKMTRGVHYVDILVRRNGKDERHEGDWLKGVRALLEQLNPGLNPAEAPVPVVLANTMLWLKGECERLHAALREVEKHCPCGARPESPTTHPHVGGCPVGALWLKWSGSESPACREVRILPGSPRRPRRN